MSRRERRRTRTAVDLPPRSSRRSGRTAMVLTAGAFAGLAVGFGLSQPEQLGPLRGIADGAIVGSAIVRHMESLSQPGANVADILRQKTPLERLQIAGRMWKSAMESSMMSKELLSVML